MNAGPDGRRALGINMFAGYRWAQIWTARAQVGRRSIMVLVGTGAGRVWEEYGTIRARFITTSSVHTIHFLKVHSNINLAIIKNWEQSFRPPINRDIKFWRSTLSHSSISGQEGAGEGRAGAGWDQGGRGHWHGRGTRECFIYFLGPGRAGGRTMLPLLSTWISWL